MSPRSVQLAANIFFPSYQKYMGVYMDFVFNWLSCHDTSVGEYIFHVQRAKSCKTNPMTKTEWAKGLFENYVVIHMCGKNISRHMLQLPIHHRKHLSLFLSLKSRP